MADGFFAKLTPGQQKAALEYRGPEDHGDKVVERALLLANRRETLSRLAPRCPACATEQVQLVDYFVAPSEWRCRKCRHRFIYEPNT